MLAHGGEEVERGEAAVADGHDAALGQPSPELQEALARPVGEALVAQPPLVVVALAEAEHGEERRRPDTAYPGDGTSSMKASQRRPLALTKWPRLERTGSR